MNRKWTDEELNTYAADVAQMRHKVDIVDAFMTTLERLRELQWRFNKVRERQWMPYNRDRQNPEDNP